MDNICTICNSKDIQRLFERGSYYMCRCRNCGVIYQFPQDDREEYFKEICKHYREVDPSFKVASSRDKLYKKFLNQIKQIKKIDSKILDIGSGEGYFLSLAKKYGWDTYGVEIVPELAKKAIQNYRVNIQNVAFEQAVFLDNYFDVITLWNVFEEHLNPQDSILKMKRFLKPGGIIFLRTPNANIHLFIYALTENLKRIHLREIIPKQSFLFHIFSYSPKSLRLLLTKTGFDNIRIKNSQVTIGDPYASGKGARIYKKLLFSIAQLFFILSSGNLIFAPSIEVFAKNKKG